MNQKLVFYKLLVKIRRSLIWTCSTHTINIGGNNARGKFHISAMQNDQVLLSSLGVKWEIFWQKLMLRTKTFRRQFEQSTVHSHSYLTNKMFSQIPFTNSPLNLFGEKLCSF